MQIKQSELILNADGSVYHFNLKPENIAKDIIFVGDQDRVDKITKYFDAIEFTTQKREFKTTTGTYKNKRFSVISTGIGPDNIDIVMNELDALVNIDLTTRKPKENLSQLNIVRIGTSGSLQVDIPVDSFLISSFGLDLNGLLHSYQIESICNTDIENAFVKHTNWSTKKAAPIIIKNSKILEKKLNIPLGIIPAGTANDFARQLNIPTQIEEAVEVILENNIQNAKNQLKNAEISYNNALVTLNSAKESKNQQLAQSR